MELNEWVKESRTAAKLTQEQLGDALGRGKATISGWEKGDYEPSYDQVIAIYERTFRKVPLPNKTGSAPDLQASTGGELPAPVAEVVRAVVVAAEKGVPVTGLNAVRQTLEIMAELASVRTIDESLTAQDSLRAGDVKAAIETIGGPRLSGATNERRRGKSRNSA
jgi:transcriptional regulator with XRE-family HTH domain